MVDARTGARTAEVDGETAVAGSSADGHAVGANGRGAARLADAGAEHVGSELLGGHGGGHGARDGLWIDARVSYGHRRASGARFRAIARKKRGLVIHRETSQLWEATNRPQVNRRSENGSTVCDSSFRPEMRFGDPRRGIEPSDPITAERNCGSGSGG